MRLAQSEAVIIEAEIRRLEADPSVQKPELRLFLQLPMPCGHPAGNLFTSRDSEWRTDEAVSPCLMCE